MKAALVVLVNDGLLIKAVGIFSESNAGGVEKSVSKFPEFDCYVEDIEIPDSTEWGAWLYVVADHKPNSVSFSNIRVFTDKCEARSYFLSRSKQITPQKKARIFCVNFDMKLSVVSQFPK